MQPFIDFFAAYPLDVFAHLFLLLPVAVAGYRQQSMTWKLLTVALYFIIRFVEETVLLYYILLPANTHTLSNGIVLIDILLIGNVYLTNSSGRVYSRRLTLISITLAFFVALVNVISNESASLGGSVMRLLMISLPLVYYNTILTENRVRNILYHPMFWISAGFLFFGMGTFMTSLFKDFLLDPGVTQKSTYDLFADMGQFLSIILCIFSAIGLWVSKLDKDNYIQPA